MGFLQRLEQRSSLENPSVPLSSEKILEVLGSQETRAGTRVSESNALRILAVLACVRIIAESVASLPLVVYKRRDSRGKDRAGEHPLYRILHDRPNPELSAMRFRELLQAHVLVWGNAFAEIETNQAGTVIGLWPLLPDRTTVRRVNGARVYTTRLPTGEIKTLSAERVFQFSGLGFDGLKGYSPIDLARESLGLTVAAEAFGQQFFGQGLSPSGVVEHPKTLSPQATTNLRRTLEDQYTGLSKSHRLMILEEGMKWQSIGIPPNNAQFLETRKFQLNEIARLFRVPPHMLADLQAGASYASVEQMSLDFVAYTLRPWLVRWEQDLNNDLFGSRERETFFAEHLVDGLLRGDIQARYNAYQVARQNGWLSANDIREIENMNPIPGGDAYLVNGNMIPADAAGQKAAPAATETPAPRSYVGLLRNVGERMLKRELPQLRKAAKQGEAGWSQAVEAVYRDHAEYFAKDLQPVFDALLSFGPPAARALTRTSRPLADELTAKELSESRRELEAAGFAGAEALFAIWETTRAERFAETAAAFIDELLNTKPTVRVA